MSRALAALCKKGSQFIVRVVIEELMPTVGTVCREGLETSLDTLYGAQESPRMLLK